MNSMIQRDAELDDANLRLGFFDVYHRNSFKEPARTTWIEGTESRIYGDCSARVIPSHAYRDYRWGISKL